MKLACVLCMGFFASAMQYGVADDNRFDGADAFVIAAKNHWNVPGLSIAVVKDGNVVLTKAYGVCEVGASRRVDANTRFDIASCTKSFTAASVAILVDRGELRWDDPVLKHLPDLRFPNEFMTRHVTLRDLLCHRTGLPRGDLIFVQDDITQAEMLRRIQRMIPESSMRTQLSYNNLMFVLVHEVVAQVAKTEWDRFVVQNLLAPLAMDHSTFSIGDEERLNFAPRHWRNEGRITSRGPPTAGSMYSSAADMAKWIQFQLAYGRVGGRQIISEDSIREMHAMHHSTPVRKRPKNNPYAARFYGAGLGWFTLDYRGRKLVMHTGSWGSAVALVPEENLGVVVLSNLDWNGMSGMLMYRMLDAYCAPSKSTWAIDDFKQFDSEGPGYAYRSRDRERARLEAARSRVTKPSLPLGEYAGRYRSSFFGELDVSHQNEMLLLKIGRFTTEMTHWENDCFYAKAPTRLNYDWLVQFDVEHGGVTAVTLKYVGWKEPDARFYKQN